jgi:hypothetical protein
MHSRNKVDVKRPEGFLYEILGKISIRPQSQMISLVLLFYLFYNYLNITIKYQMFDF